MTISNALFNCLRYGPHIQVMGSLGPLGDMAFFVESPNVCLTDFGSFV